MTLSKVIVSISHVPSIDNYFSSQIKRQNREFVKILKVVRSLRVLEWNCYLKEMLWNIKYWVLWLNKQSHIPHLAWARGCDPFFSLSLLCSEPLNRCEKSRGHLMKWSLCMPFLTTDWNRCRHFVWQAPGAALDFISGASMKPHLNFSMITSVMATEVISWRDWNESRDLSSPPEAHLQSF